MESLWTLLKKDLEEELQHTQRIFVTFSLHDSSHSRSILRNIERFLGKDRIERLSVTDTFMLLVCAYVHDLGMALTIEDVLKILDGDDFQKFIIDKDSSPDLLEEEDQKAVRILAKYIKNELGKNNTNPKMAERKPNLAAVYFAVIVVIQMYIRPEHWKGAIKIESHYRDLLKHRLNIRFVRNIVSICQTHGQNINVLKELEPEADGFDDDVYHPRFIAAMLRLGDLLDVDNGRFPKWFFEAEEHGAEFIPKLSDLHFKKHESISHLRITPEYIAITSSCFSGGDHYYDEDVYAVAKTVAEWFNWIREDWEYLSRNWSIISAGQFGAPPGELRLKILVDGKPYFSTQQYPQMQIPQNRIMKLLEGTNIYQNRYVAVRELLQNAIDASLLQLWYDITHNVYANIGIGKNTWETYLQNNEKDTSFPIWTIPNEIYENYKILVEVVWDKDRNQIRLVVKDRGVGIALEDVSYMVRVGSSKNENPRIRKILKTMPNWLKPSGIFGIGLQSAFQLSNKLQFYTRRPNEPERHIIFYSYGKGRGQTEIRELPDNPREPFYDNSPQGTNVVLEIDIDKILPNGGLDVPEIFLNLDLKFTPKEPMETAYIILSSVVQNELRAVNCDYFRVTFQNLIVENRVSTQRGRPISCRSSLFSVPAHKDKIYLPLSLGKLIADRTEYCFSNTTALYWDMDTSRFFRLTIQPCKIENGCVQFPPSRADLYRVLYKFNEISNTESLYENNPDGDYLLNMKRNGLVSWDILIMDGSPEKYMNIDRDRLKKGAVYEEHLLEVKRRVLEKWCQFFVEIERAKTAQRDRTRFKGQKNYLVSLMLLFYRYVPKELFEEFARYFESALADLCINGYQYPLKNLWDFKSKFVTTYRLSAKKTKKVSPRFPLGVATVDLLSHRLFHIEQICGVFSPKYQKVTSIQYVSHLGGNFPSIEAIEMDKAASIFDYMMVFDPTSQDPTHVLLESVIKKVFKPNAQYAEIITPTYPSSFRRGRNFCWRMDSSIRSFILSPFDDTSFRIMKKYLKQESGADLSMEKKGAFISEMMSYFSSKSPRQPGSQQLFYCAKYVLYMRKEYNVLPSDIDEDGEISKIMGTYWSFVKDFCCTIFENFSLILNQFKPNQD